MVSIGQWQILWIFDGIGRLRAFQLYVRVVLSTEDAGLAVR